MKLAQWDIWRAQPPGLSQPHWFVLVAGQERLNHPQLLQINALACFTLRGPLRSVDVQLDEADGFQAPTACQCDLIYFLENKHRLLDRLGQVTWERQQAIKSKLKEVLRL